MTNVESMDLDALLRQIRELLPDPIREERQIDGAVVFVGGDPGEVIVRIGKNKVSIAVFSVTWNGPCTPVVRPQELAALNWRRLPAARMMMALNDMVGVAIAIRRTKYRKCERCGETNPPEWMHDETTCQSCAEKHLGVVY